MTSLGTAGFASTQTEVAVSATGATSFEVLVGCTVPCTVGIPVFFPVLGMVPVLLTTSPLKSGHPVPRKENPKGNNLGREGGRQRHHRRVHQDSKPVSPFCVSTFVWCCHTESPANSLREVRRLSHGLGLTFSQRSFREEASLGTFKASSGGGAR